MTDPLDAKEFQAELQRLEALLHGVERFPTRRRRPTRAKLCGPSSTCTAPA